MVRLDKLRKDKTKATANGFIMDEITRQTMKELGFQFIRSCGKNEPNVKKARRIDRKKAIERFGKKVDLSLYAIHHCYNGLVGLAPREVHTSMHHNGYFYRLGLSA